jgi:hypothetical protein
VIGPLAHGSGIDEAIVVLVPLACLIVLLRMGAKKAPPEDEPPSADDDGQHST